MVDFGVQIWQEEFAFERLKEIWRDFEEMGYNSAWIYDHFYPLSDKTGKNILEAWTLLPCLAAETEHLRVGVLVTCNAFRYPSVLAKIAATADVMTRGRLEFGIGAGWHKEEHDAYGIKFPKATIRIEHLAEAMELIKRVWTMKKATFRGKYYTINDLVSYPKPLQKPYPPIWIGGLGDRLLRIVAQHANYANFAGCSIKEYQERLVVLKRHCLETGSKFEDLRKTWHGFVIIAEEREAKKKALEFKESFCYAREIAFDKFFDTIIAGTPEQCVDKIQGYIDLGVTYFIPHFLFSKDLETPLIFIDEVASAFK